MNTNFSLKPGATSTTKMLLNCLRSHADLSMEEICHITGLHASSIRSNLYYYVKIGLVEKTGVKPNYLYKLK